MFSSFVHSGTYQPIGGGKFIAFSCFVQVLAALSLRNFLSFRFGALCHNKANNYAPCGRRTRLAPRLFLNR